MTSYPAIYTGDCLDIMPTLPAESVDSIVTDPPYGLSFMGKDWDHGVPGVHFWREALRAAKPGAFLLAFGGTRTFHRLAVAIEDAGWEMRDTVMWVYGSGFPKSLDVGKAIDKAAGAEREIVGAQLYTSAKMKAGDCHIGNLDAPRVINNITAPATDAAREWDGWGTALKPAWEPIIVARKPLIGTVAENVLRYGTGAINVDAGRVGTEDALGGGAEKRSSANFEAFDRPWKHDPDAQDRMAAQVRLKVARAESLGRWPANLIHDGSDEVTAGFPHRTSAVTRFRVKGRSAGIMGGEGAERDYVGGFGDTGSAARFFYCAKASKADRDEGCEGLEITETPYRQVNSEWKSDARHPDGGYATAPQPKARNHHPTVKPTALMRYLVRLVTRRGGVVLDPFMGSGSTGKACAYEGMEFIGIDLSPEYCKIAARRIAAVAQPTLMEAAA